jgi:hypothetical protein
MPRYSVLAASVRNSNALTSTVLFVDCLLIPLTASRASFRLKIAGYDARGGKRFVYGTVGFGVNSISVEERQTETKSKSFKQSYPT